MKNLPKSLLIVFFFLLPILILSSIFNSGYNNLEPLYKVKLEKFLKIKDNIDIVFIGTSITWRHMITWIFDKEIRKSNLHYNSYNFGIPNMKYGEVLYLLKEIRKLKPKRLQFIIMETGIDQNSLAIKLHNTRKFVFWHDFGNTIKALMIENEYNKNLGRKIKFFYYHLRAFYLNLATKGNGFYALNYLYKFKKKQINLYSMYNKKIKNGTLSLDKEYGLKSKRHQWFLKRIKNFSKSMDKIRKSKTKKNNIYNSRQYLYDHLIQWSKEMNVELLFASIFLGNLDYSVTTMKKKYPVLQLSNPKKYPSLYKTNRWFDFTHLNIKGATEASRYLAKLFVQFISKKNKINRIDSKSKELSN